jgi:ParB-like chromosome segregation protein Spo0J
MTQGPQKVKMEMVALKKIRSEGDGWDAYLLRNRVDTAKLAKSVQQNGIVEPVTLEEWNGGYRIVCGFVRVAAARAAGADQVPAVVHAKSALSPREGYMTALSSNAGGSSLTDADRIMALSKGRNVFGLTEDELVTLVAPLLGLPQSHKVIREYVKLAALPKGLLDILAEGAISRQHAEAMLLVEAEDQEWFYRNVVDLLALSASETRSFAAGGLDLAGRGQLSFREVMIEVIGAAFAGEEPPDSAAALQKARLLARISLARKLTPTIAQMEDEFAQLVKSIELPAGAKVEHAVNFESDEVIIEATIKSEDALRSLKSALERGLAAGTFAKMLSLASRKAEAVEPRPQKPRKAKE